MNNKHRLSIVINGCCSEARRNTTSEANFGATFIFMNVARLPGADDVFANCPMIVSGGLRCSVRGTKFSQLKFAFMFNDYTLVVAGVACADFKLLVDSFRRICFFSNRSVASCFKPFFTIASMSSSSISSEVPAKRQKTESSTTSSLSVSADSILLSHLDLLLPLQLEKYLDWYDNRTLSMTCKQVWSHPRRPGSSLRVNIDSDSGMRFHGQYRIVNMEVQLPRTVSRDVFESLFTHYIDILDLMLDVHCPALVEEHRLVVNYLPPRLTKLTLYNYTLDMEELIPLLAHLPSSMRHLAFETDAQMISADMLPSSLMSLKLGCSESTTVLLGSHATLHSLTLTTDFNQPLTDETFTLPPSLVCFTLMSINYTHELLADRLPSLTHLSLAEYYSKGTCQCPDNCPRFRISPSRPLFSSELQLHSLDRITEFALPFTYNRPLTRTSLPRNLETLIINPSYDHPLSASNLPPSLTSIFKAYSYRNTPCVVSTFSIVGLHELNALHISDPRMVPSFKLCLSTVELPPSLTELGLSHFTLPTLSSTLATSLVSLRLNWESDFNQPLRLGGLSSLRVLILNNEFNQPLSDACLPASLTTLKFGGRFNQVIQLTSLTNLTTLHLGSAFNQIVDGNTFPASLTSLSFSQHFNSPLLESYVPSNLTHISFPYFSSFTNVLQLAHTRLSVLDLQRCTEFNQPFTDATFSIPTTLTLLRIGDKYNQTLSAQAAAIVVDDNYSPRTPDCWARGE